MKEPELPPNLKCMKMREEHLQECMELATSSFMEEPMMMAMNVTRSNLENYFPRRLKDMFDDGISNVIWDEEKGKVAACGFDEIVFPGKPTGPEGALVWCQEPRITEAYQLFAQLYKGVDLYKMYNVDQYVGLQVGATHPDYRGKGLHLANALARIKYGQEKGVHLFCVVPTGRFSQRVYEKLDFEIVSELPYEDVRIYGQPMPNLSSLGQHKSIRIMAKLMKE